MTDGKGDGEVSKEAVLAALSQIEDPDLHRDIVSLGFVPDEDINICGGSVSVRIVLTTPACPVREKMKAQAEELLLALPGVDHAEVKMDADGALHGDGAASSRWRACGTSSRWPRTRAAWASPRWR